jgi:WD40 repeat protein
MAKLSQPPSLAPRWRADVGDHVIALVWSPDGAALAAASVSGPITIFDAASGAVKHTLKGHGFGTAALDWQPGGQLLASAGQDGKARLWDAVDGREVAALDGGAAWVERVAWGPKGERLVSAAGKRLRLWNSAGELLRAYPDQPATIADVKWNAKGREFAAGGYGGVTLFTPDADAPRAHFEWRGSVLALAWSPDGKFIAGGAQDASVHFWHTKDGKDLEMTGYPQKVRELSWDATSTYLATGGGEQVTVWDCSGKGPVGRAPLSFELHEQPLGALAFQRRGPLLASGCAGGLLALWLPGGSKKVLAQTKLSAGVTQAAWSPSDGRLAIGGEAGEVVVFAV